MVSANVIALLYLLSAVLFIFGLKGLTGIRSARRGNALAALAMLLAGITTLVDIGKADYRWIVAGLVIGGGIGAYVALKIAMTAMPEMVALFNGFGGGASALVALSVISLAILEGGEPLGASASISGFVSVLIGGITLTGSLVAFAKLSGKLGGAPIILPGRHWINGFLVLTTLGAAIYFLLSSGADATALVTSFLVATALSLALGVLLVIPIGGADMPVVISLLNSLSGLAAASTGFVLSNNLLIIGGALVGASGLILTQIMCGAMNRTLPNVLFAGFGGVSAASDSRDYQNITSYGPEEAAMVLESAMSVIIVPGYGLAVAQAQHAARELGDLLEARGAKVAYAIHPVAGRMPGHMNVLLADADVPYEKLFEMSAINSEFKTTDVVLVVGANDVVNPAAETDPQSPIAGMPILKCYEAQTVLMIKRSLSPGFAGIKNALFENDNTMMIFGDAKVVLQGLLAELKELGTA
ncbi:MAG: NAD(P)(+) transhydrogenase (Re/Si-specific) subunit beta [Acidobacteria bacterium]|nr:NAD(P)(+) transhydrogenase (Re/Si-specific) subunit beta [Acidobacteriota bacterium]